MTPAAGLSQQQRGVGSASEQHTPLPMLGSGPPGSSEWAGGLAASVQQSMGKQQLLQQLQQQAGVGASMPLQGAQAQVGGLASA